MTTNFPVTRSERPEPFNFTLEVEQDFIDNGFMGDMCHCPIALALKAKLPKSSQEPAFVSLERVVVDVPGFTECWAEVSHEMASFILDFDAGKAVEPRSFTLCFHPVYGG